MKIDLPHASPAVADTAWIAPSAFLIGEVDVAEKASIWFGAVLRGDDGPIRVGEGSNVQDGCVLHTDPGYTLTLGREVSIGHRVVLHGCTIEDAVLVGMGALVMNGAVIGAGSLVAAGAVVAAHTQVHPGSLVLGVPGKVRGGVSVEQRTANVANARHYVDLADRLRTALAADRD